MEKDKTIEVLCHECQKKIEHIGLIYNGKFYHTDCIPKGITIRINSDNQSKKTTPYDYTKIS